MKNNERVTTKDVVRYQFPMRGLCVTCFLLSSVLNNVNAETNTSDYVKSSSELKQVMQVQQTAVKGIITDEKGEPIIGANIVVKGTEVGTISDVDGAFQVNAPVGAVLHITYIGYLPIDVTVKGSSAMNIVMKEDTKNLDEVVVVGYGTMKKKDLTGAVSSVKMDETPVATVSTISHALAGKAAGLQVNTVSAQPGGQASFRIRGAASTGAGNDPLIIIDGFPVTSSGEPGSGNRYDGGPKDNVLASINPNDIESIEVLKDASATAIYGSRAGHGVIIVTTKRGKQGKPLIKYSGTVALQNIAKNYDMLNARDFMIESNRFLREEWMLNNKVAPYGTNNIQDIKDSFVPRFSDADIANPINSTDWMNEVTRTGFQQQHNVSMNGGTDGTQYMVSLNYFKQDGIIKNNDMTRYAGRVNLDQQINKYLKTGVSLALNRNDFGNVPVGNSGNEYAGTIVSAMQFNPLIPIRDENGNYALNSAAAFLPNPVSLLEIDDKSRQERVLGTMYLEAEPIKDLKIKANMGLDRNYQKRKTYLPKTTLYGQKKNGEASINQYDKTDYLFELTGNYQKTINAHSFNVLGGYSYQKFEGEGMNAANSDFLIDGFGYNNLGAGAFSKPTVGSWGNSSCMASFFGRVNYSLLDRYLVTATLRADGASNLAKNHKWGYFPSVALGWRFSEENFMERARDVITNGKLRVSYGETGNSNIGNRALDYYSITGEYVFGDIAYKGVGLGQLGNPNLKWETTKEWNFGLDLGLYDRVNISAEVFSRRIVDLLSTRNLMSFLEVGAIAANIGSTKSKGFELTVGSRNIITSSFNWSSDVTFSMYRDTWVMRDPSWIPAAYEKYNDPIRSAYGYKSAGLIQPGETIDHMPGALPGQVKIQDLDSYRYDEKGKIMVDKYGIPMKTGKPDGKLDDADKVYYGSWDPGFQIGFNNTFSYKKFDLSFYMYGVFNKLSSGSYLDFGPTGIEDIRRGYNMPSTTKEIWSADNQNTERPGYFQSRSRFGTGDYFMEKIWFVRMRNVALGYNFSIPKVASNVRVYVDINNPFVFTNYKGLDPETDNHSAAYPNVRTYSLGIDITF